MQVQGGFRREMDPADIEDFDEFNATLYGEIPFTEKMELFAMGNYARRNISGGPTENAFLALGGARYNLGVIEVHGEYAFTKNDSNDLRTFTRHQVNLGLRYWY